jgi:hypothetical protein
LGTLYTGVAANAPLSSATQATVPADGDNDNAATFTVGMQKIIDYIEALRVGVSGAFSEGFESATFPPVATSTWSTPSKNFGTDSAWVRTTTGPLVGTASASAPTPQTLSTNSSLGLSAFLASPSRLQFVFAVTCNANNGDHLDFFVDGVLTAQFSSTTGPAAVAGTFYTDCLREGLHTFDWRFVRGGSASVGSEKCLIDTVQIIPEGAWAEDPTLTRFYLNDDLPYGFGIATTTTLNSPTGNMVGFWHFLSSANLGNIQGDVNNGGVMTKGEVQFATANVAAGDFVKMLMNQRGASLGNAFTLAKSVFTEWRISPINAWTANMVLETGVGSSITATDFAGWALDGSASTTNWRWRTRTSGGVATTLDPGVVASSLTYVRLGVITSTVGGISSAIFLKDGKALPGAASIPPISITNLPTTVLPQTEIRSVTVAATVTALADWCKCLALR